LYPLFFVKYQRYLRYTVFAMFTIFLSNFDTGCAHSTNPAQHHTPRYLDQYSRAKQGIDAEERALQARLHAEISTDFQHLDGDTSSMEKRKPQKPASPSHKSAIAELRRHIQARRNAAANDMVVKHRLRVKRLAQRRLIEAAHVRKAVDTSSTASDSSLNTNQALHPKSPAPHFDIHTVHRFDPGQSLSFARELFETFALSYADTSLMTGYVGRDIVQLGANQPIAHSSSILHLQVTGL
jgi:hypothetical protein